MHTLYRIIFVRTCMFVGAHAHTHTCMFLHYTHTFSQEIPTQTTKPCSPVACLCPFMFYNQNRLSFSISLAYL